MQNRRRYTAEQKVKILREHLDNQVPISELSKKYGIHPNMINRWKKALFEGAVETFTQKHSKRNGKSKREEHLEQKIQNMRDVVTEISTENVQLKKKYNGEI